MRHNLVFIDNKPKVLRNQLDKLQSLLGKCSSINSSIDEDSNVIYNFTELKSSLKVFSLLTILNSTELDGEGNLVFEGEGRLEGFISTVRDVFKSDEPTLFVVDLCLDYPKDSKIETGIAIGKKLLAEKDDPSIWDVLYTTGNASYWDPGKSGINVLNYAPRAVTSDCDFDDKYRAGTVSPFFLFGEKLDTKYEIYKVTEDLLKDTTVNSQYMGAILKKVFLQGAKKT